MASRRLALHQMTPRANRLLLVVVVLFATVIAAVACGSDLRANVNPAQHSDEVQVDARATFPPGRDGDLIRYGYNLFANTRQFAKPYVTAQMSCAACHVAAGRQPRAGSLLGVYAQFPQWNRRAHRFIALQDRIAECFLYSMNGRPPAYSSREMIAMTAYVAFLSRNAPTGTGFPDQEPVKLPPGLTPNSKNGALIFASRCAACHGMNGEGAGLRYPPLWGPHTFNDKAGMSRMDRIAPFIKTAMPQNAPGSLTDQQALDVAAYILSKPRPHFKGSRAIVFPAQRADYF